MTQQGKITLDLNVASDESLRAWVKDLIQGQVTSIMANDIRVILSDNLKKWVTEIVTKHIQDLLKEMSSPSAGYGRTTKDTIKGMVDDFVRAQVDKKLAEVVNEEAIKAEIRAEVNRLVVNMMVEKKK